jgi:hypothetical protein
MAYSDNIYIIMHYTAMLLFSRRGKKQVSIEEVVVDPSLSYAFVSPLETQTRESIIRPGHVKTKIHTLQVRPILVGIKADIFLDLDHEFFA